MAEGTSRACYEFGSHGDIIIASSSLHWFLFLEIII